jgi:hypothetical protein
MGWIKNIRCCIYMDCSICLDATGFLECGAKPRTCDDVRLKCTHVFHRRCIKEWFVQKDACPVCRRELKFREGAYFKQLMLLYELYRETRKYIIDDEYDEMYDCLYIYHDNATMILFVNDIRQNRLHFSHTGFMCLETGICNGF